MTDAEIDVGGGMDIEMEDDPNVRRRGRGFNSREDAAEDGVRSSGFETLDGKTDAVEDNKAARSIEGWIILVTNIHEEATEEEVTDKFADFGDIKNLHLNLDRRTGYVKGYALIEYENLSEAKEAIHACGQGLTLMDKELKADFAFVKPPAYASRNGGGASIRGRARHGDGGQRGGAGGRNRSRSPGR